MLQHSSFTTPQDATELVSRLASFHYTAQTRPEKKHFAQYGLDLVNGAVRNNVEAGVLEPVLSKVKIVQVILRKRFDHPLNNKLPMTLCNNLEDSILECVLSRLCR